MVRLDRIYTRSGDSGKTSLGDGTRVPKTSLRIAATGSVDELNCQIGVARSQCECNIINGLLETLQQRLFDLGADLSCPVPEPGEPDRCPRMTADHSTWLEARIDHCTERLNPLTSFVLPGGTPAAAALHVARAICRRAECDVLRLQKAEGSSVNPAVVVFLNRLSDLLFVLARRANDDGKLDVLWIPGKS